LKEDQIKTISAKFGLVWLCGFIGKDLNVKEFNVRRTLDEGVDEHQMMTKAHMAFGKVS
jgi:hypothetical protein